jgi:hypothetical protein
MTESKVMPITLLGDESQSWRKSSYSAANGECVEVAAYSGRRISIRDSNDPEGPVINCSADTFRSFLDAAISGVLPN